ncbi:MAG: M57 family metalloprotease, partial [Candidatus Nanopelagicales bacterium]|nr:M57 family metalloprotease [Candidatus Nanopelagicales bacterium]
AGIRVSISGQLSGGWQEATRQAIEEWTAITGSRVEFVESGPAQITVTSACCLGGAVAIASFPSNGQPGPTIQVSTAYESYTASEKLFVMAHEFGHTIGFRHTNWNVTTEDCGAEPENPYGAIIVGNTPATDALSVMNKCSGGTEWSGFSFWDVEAARVLYNNSPTLSLTVPPNNDRLLTWTSVDGASNYWVQATYRRCWDDYEFGYMCDPDWNEWHNVYSLQYTDTTVCEYNQWGYPGEQSWVEYRVFPRFQGGDGFLASNTTAETPDVQPCWWLF